MRPSQYVPLIALLGFLVFFSVVTLNNSQPLPAGEANSATRAAQPRLERQAAGDESNGQQKRQHEVFHLMITSAKYSSAFWPFWLAHYTNASHQLDLIPKANFLIFVHVDNVSAPPVEVGFWEEHGITPTLWQGSFERKGPISKTAQQGLPRQAWLMESDDDELVAFPPGSIFNFLSQLEASGHNAINGQFVDQVAADCSLPRVQPDRPLWEQFPCVSTITKKFFKGYTFKKPLHKAYLVTGEGHHTFIDRNQSVSMPKKIFAVHHFKWRDGCQEKLRQRLTYLGKMAAAREAINFVHFYDQFGKVPAPECGCVDPQLVKTFLATASPKKPTRTPAPPSSSSTQT